MINAIAERHRKHMAVMDDKRKIEELEAKLKTSEEIGRAFEEDAGQLRAKLDKAVAALLECQEEIDQYSKQEYPLDHPVHERYRKRDFDANPARIALAEIKGETK